MGTSSTLFAQQNRADDEPLAAEISNLLVASTYEERYKDTLVQELTLALDILSVLKADLVTKDSDLPWKLLRRAHLHLEDELRAHISNPRNS